MPQSTTISNKLSRLSTRGLTPALLNAANDSTDVGGLVRIQSAQSGDNRMSPMAAGSTTITYEPAHIRSAYGLAPLPTSFAGLSPSQLAQFGAGQTVYIVNAHHNPNVANELAIFNKKFGLPNCTIKPILPTATLPLPSTNPTGCELSVVYNTAEGNMTATAPSYESGWATEIALDV
jgi:subtilase family serine protease